MLFKQFGTYSSFEELQNKSDNHDEDNEMEVDDQKTDRMLASENRLSKVFELLNWLKHEGEAHFNETLDVSLLPKKVPHLFQGQKNKSVTPLGFILSILAQLKENELSKAEELSTQENPQKKRSELELEVLNELESQVGTKSPYENFVISSTKQYISSRIERLEASKSKQATPTEEKNSLSWLYEQYQKVGDFLKSEKAIGKALPAFRPQNKRPRKEQGSSPTIDHAEALEAGKTGLFASYRLICQGAASLAPQSIQQRAHLAFSAAYEGNFSKLKAVVSNDLPVNLEDSLGLSLLSVAVLGDDNRAHRASICKFILDTAIQQFFDLQKVKKSVNSKDPNAQKLDNYKLFQKNQAGCDDDADISDDEEDEEDDDNADMAANVPQGKTATSPVLLLTHLQQLPIFLVEKYLQARNRVEIASLFNGLLQEELKDVSSSRGFSGNCYLSTASYRVNAAAVAIMSSNYECLEVMLEAGKLLDTSSSSALFSTEPKSLSQQIVWSMKNVAIAFDDPQALAIMIRLAGGYASWDAAAALTGTKVVTVYESLHADTSVPEIGSVKSKLTEKEIKRILENYGGLKTSIDLRQKHTYKPRLNYPATFNELATAFGATSILKWLHAGKHIVEFKALLASRGTIARTLQQWIDRVVRVVKREHKRREKDGKHGSESDLIALIDKLNTEHNSAVLLGRIAAGVHLSEYNMGNRSILYYAITAGQASSIKCILELLDHDTKIKLLHTPCEWKDPDTLLPLAVAIQNNSPHCFAELVNAGADVLETHGTNNALQTAVGKGDYQLARWIVSQLNEEVAKKIIVQDNHEQVSTLMTCASAARVSLTFLTELLEKLTLNTNNPQTVLQPTLGKVDSKGRNILRVSYASNLMNTFKVLRRKAQEASMSVEQRYHREDIESGGTLFDKAVAIQHRAYSNYDFNSNIFKHELVQQRSKLESTFLNTTGPCLYELLKKNKKDSSGALQVTVEGTAYCAWFVPHKHASIFNVQEKEQFESETAEGKIGVGIANNSNCSYFVNGEQVEQLNIEHISLINELTERAAEQVVFAGQFPFDEVDYDTPCSNRDELRKLSTLVTDVTKAQSRIMAQFRDVRHYASRRLEAHNKTGNYPPPCKCYLDVIEHPSDQQLVFDDSSLRVLQSMAQLDWTWEKGQRFMKEFLDAKYAGSGLTPYGHRQLVKRVKMY